MLQKSEKLETSPTDSRYNLFVWYMDMNCELGNQGTIHSHQFIILWILLFSDMG